MSVNLVKATEADIPALIELEKSVPRTHIYSPMLEAAEWHEEFAKGVVVYLIRKDGRLAGNASYEKKSENHIYLTGLLIRPEFQGQGVAREVLNRFLDEFKNVGRIDLVTHPDNKIALKLYESLGFVVESRKENYYGDGEPRLILRLLRVKSDR